jgi:hypothetical protein
MIPLQATRPPGRRSMLVFDAAPGGQLSAVSREEQSP